MPSLHPRKGLPTRPGNGERPRSAVRRARDRQPAPAAGIPPEAASVTLARLPVEFCDPSRPGQALSAADLDLLSGNLATLLGVGQADDTVFHGTRALAVCPGEIIARLPADLADGARSADGNGSEAGPPPAPPLRCGVNVELSPLGEYRALRYGYACCLDRGLSVLSPLWLDPAAMHLYWLVLDDRPHPVTVEMLQQCAGDLDIAATLDTEAVRQLVDRAQRGSAARGRLEIASGVPALDGQVEKREILVDLAGRAGRPNLDGSIDFRETGAIPVVIANQPLARRAAGDPSRPGRDLRGHSIAAAEADPACLMAGDNVRVETVDGVQQYYSAIDGAVILENDTLSVSPCLSISGDVDFDTGNLDFDGEIFIKGSVTQGFAVTARGPVTIGGAVEPGSTVTSQTDVAVGQGIIGIKTRVRAGGNVRAQFVQEAAVTADGQTTLGNFAYQATIHCGGQLTVAGGSGSRGGSIVGGRTWARGGVLARTIGGPAHPLTVVATGVEPEQVQQLERVAKGLETSHEHILRILRLFGLTRIDATQIRNLIQASAGPHRKLLASRARQLGQLAKVYQSLVAQKDALESDIEGVASRACIRATDIAHPGADIRVGAHRRVLDCEVRAARFHIAGNRLCER